MLNAADQLGVLSGINGVITSSNPSVDDFMNPIRTNFNVGNLVRASLPFAVIGVGRKLFGQKSMFGGMVKFW